VKIKEYIENKLKKFHVAIPKIYFPEELWTEKFDRYYAHVDVIASSRTEAAEKVWMQYSEKWLREMGPKKTYRRVISLYVNDPDIETDGKVSKLMPIKVFEE